MKKLFILIAATLSAYQMQAQCPTITSCPTAALDVCDYSNNNSAFWNANYWFDNIVGTHDLAEGAADLSISAKDACFSGGLNFRYQLFLDLDNNGTMETVVDSKTPIPAGGLYYNNAANPNYSGGTFRVFDQRPVAPLLKYRFGLQVSGIGNTKTAHVRWRTSGAPNYATPQLPYGTHKIKWIVTDANGNQQVCEYGFTVKDCQKPSVQCLFIPSVSIMPTGMLTLFASDFVQSTQDNVTPANLLKLSVRKAGTGTGFPVDANGNPVLNVTYTCIEQGLQTVEIWAKDLAGNTDYCLANLNLQDNFNNCAPGDALFHICIEDFGSTFGISDTYLIISSTDPVVPNVIVISSNFDNACQGVGSIPFTADTISIKPVKDDNPLNGVSTYDLVLIQKHMNGSQPFTSPRQYIAADADRNNIIDTFDIIELRKLIYGTYSELPNNTSWRFVKSNYVFPADPLSTPFPESVSLAEVLATPDSTFTFKAIKIGDLNGSAIANFGEQSTEDREDVLLDPKQLAVFPPQPNPTTGGSVIPLRLPETSQVRLDLFDLSGRITYSFENQMDAGEALVKIPAGAMPNTGVYLWRVLVNGSVFSGEIVRQ